MSIRFNPLLTSGFDFVGTSGGGATGDVSGPASSTDNALVRFDGVTGKLVQTSLATLDDTGLLTVANIIDSGLTASTVPYADASKQLVSSSVTPTELGFLSGVTSALQTQLGNKASTSEDYRVERFTLDATDITNKFVTLALAPTVPTKVRMIIENSSGDQNNGIDFTVTGAQVGWSGLWLDGVMELGEKLIIVYSK